MTRCQLKSHSVAHLPPLSCSRMGGLPGKLSSYLFVSLQNNPRCQLLRYTPELTVTGCQLGSPITLAHLFHLSFRSGDLVGLSSLASW